MTSNCVQNSKNPISLVGDVKTKSSIAYQVTRMITGVVNTVQMGIVESYINGLEIPDAVLKIFLDISVQICYKYFPSLLVPYEWLLKESDNLAEGSQELMKIQYNLPAKLFTVMLGENELLYPKYTMALWEKGAINLEQAQIDMLDDVIEKVNIQDGEEILDLGCGFGSAANYILAKFPNTKVTSLNLSHEQCEYIRQKMQDSNSYLSSDRFTLYEQDFNEANFEMKFDKIIAVGLFEHIGNLTKSLQNLATFLQDDGQVFIHIITTSLHNNITHPFINKYIFPNMRVWNYNAMSKIDTDLKIINQWYLNGTNYSKTLRNWSKNFDENQPEVKELDYGIKLLCI